MKYTIIVNQVGIVRMGLAHKTDAVDWMIIDYIKDWWLSPSAKRIVKGTGSRKKEFIWINYNTIIKNMPMLKISDKHGISNRIIKLKELGLLESYSDKDNTLYLRLTDLAIYACFWDEKLVAVHRKRTGGSPEMHRGCSSQAHSTNRSTISIRSTRNRNVAAAFAAAAGLPDLNQKELNAVIMDIRSNVDNLNTLRKGKKRRAPVETDKVHVTEDDKNAVKMAFDVAWYRLYKNSERPAWGGKEMKQAKELIKRLRTVIRVERSINYVFDHWLEYKVKWHTEVPSIGLILKKVNLIGEIEDKKVEVENSAKYRRELT